MMEQHKIEAWLIKFQGDLVRDFHERFAEIYTTRLTENAWVEHLSNRISGILSFSLLKDRFGSNSKHFTLGTEPDSCVNFVKSPIDREQIRGRHALGQKTPDSGRIHHLKID